MSARRLAALPLVLSVLGCTSTHYDWGRYEESVLVVTQRPDGFDLAAEIDALETQAEKTANKDHILPPGYHAHLGYLLTVAGNFGGARRHFEAEKELFPESGRFMDRLIQQLERP